MSLRQIALLAGTTLSLLSTGCDPTRTIQQTVTLRVESHEDGRPVAGLDISIREVRERTAENARYYDYDPGYRFASIWFSSVIKSDGTAVVTVIEDALDAGRGNSPTHREAIRGRLFQCELKDGSNVLQSDKATYDVGLVINGKLYDISVVSITAPVYVSHAGEIK